MTLCIKANLEGGLRLIDQAIELYLKLLPWDHISIQLSMSIVLNLSLFHNLYQSHKTCTFKELVQNKTTMIKLEIKVLDQTTNDISLACV